MSVKSDYLSLKWGVPKAWLMENNPQSFELLQKYYDLGSSMSAMAQPNTDEHKRILCDLIDSFNGELSNDWEGCAYTKEQAKDYVMNFGSNRRANK